jgi:adenine deaminase
MLSSDPQRDLLKLAVFERYGGGSRSLGFVHGFGMRTGALAGTIGQDSQNLVVVGACDEDMALAANRVRDINGGVVVANQDMVAAELPLPIGGIMTDIAPHFLAEKRALVKGAAQRMGCTLTDPIFALSLMITLIVIPHLKMSNRGLVDVVQGRIVDLFVEAE